MKQKTLIDLDFNIDDLGKCSKCHSSKYLKRVVTLEENGYSGVSGASWHNDFSGHINGDPYFKVPTLSGSETWHNLYCTKCKIFIHYAISTVVDSRLSEELQHYNACPDCKSTNNLYLISAGINIPDTDFTEYKYSCANCNRAFYSYNVLPVKNPTGSTTGSYST